MPPLDDFFVNMKDITVENKSGCITDNAEISVLLNRQVLKNLFFHIVKLNWKKQQNQTPRYQSSTFITFSHFRKKSYTYLLPDLTACVRFCQTICGKYSQLQSNFSKI